MANELAGGKTMVFSTPSATYGYIQSYSVDQTTERAEAKGPNGHTMAIQEYNETRTLSLNYLEFATDTSPPDIGTTFTFDDGEGNDVTWYISSVNRGKTVDGFKTVDVTATHYPDLGTPDA